MDTNKITTIDLGFTIALSILLGAILASMLIKETAEFESIKEAEIALYNTINASEILLNKIEKDNPAYVLDVLTETDEYNMYTEIIEPYLENAKFYE